MCPSPLSRRRFLGLAGLAAGMGLLAACGPAAPAPAPTAAPKPTAAPAAAATTAPTTAPAAAAKPTAAATAAPTTAPATKPGATAANTLTFMFAGDTNRLDPPAMDAQEGFIATTAIYEGLVRYKSGSTETTSTPAGSTPASSAASRRAAPTGPSSSASITPPGNAGWPACRRSDWLRCTSSRSGPADPSPNRIRIAECRPPDAGGRSPAGTLICAAALASARSQSGIWPESAEAGSGSRSYPAAVTRTAPA